MKHVTSQLITKRAELKGILDKLIKEIESTKEAIKAIDASIKIFDENFDPTTIKTKRFRSRNNTFKKGEMQRFVFKILKASEFPLDAREIIEKIIIEKGLDTNNVNIQGSIEMTVRAILNKNEFIEGIKETGSPKKWKIIDFTQQQ